MFMKSLLPLAAAGAMLLAAGATKAAVVTYTTQTAYMNAFTTNPNLTTAKSDPVDWGLFANSLGIANPNNASVPNLSSFTTTGSNPGEIITASTSGGTPFTSYVNQATGVTNWRGDFLNGTTVLYSNASGGSGSIILAFATAVTGLGLDLQTKLSVAYTFTIAAFDSHNSLLGSASSSGTSTGTSSASFGTAAFAGITSDLANISYVQLTSTNASSGFAIDTSLVYHNPINQTSGGGTQTPEPGTLGLLGAGLAGLGLVRRRRIQA